MIGSSAIGSAEVGGVSTSKLITETEVAVLISDVFGYDISVSVPTVGTTTAEGINSGIIVPLSTIEPSVTDIYNFDLTVGHIPAQLNSYGNTYDITVGHLVGESNTNGYLIDPYLFIDETIVGILNADANSFTVSPFVGFASTSANAIDFTDADLFIAGAPNLVVFRNENDLTDIRIDILNPRDLYGIKVYRADGRRAPFYEHEIQPTLPWSDTSVSTGSNYRYKASFYTTGSKNGQGVEIESRKSKVGYTKGN